MAFPTQKPTNYPKNVPKEMNGNIHPSLNLSSRAQSL